MRQHIYLIIGSIIMMMLLGSVYSWSIIRVSVEADFQINATLSGIPYMTSLAAYSIAMFISGRLIARYKTVIVIVGALSFSAGLLLSSFAQNIFILTITYGVLTGLGVGFLYGVPLFIINQNFKQKIGFYSGLVLLGFGFSSVIMAPLIERLLNTTSLASMFQTLTLIAVIVFLMTLAPLITVKTPLPKKQDVVPIDITQFKLLYVIFLLSLISGLMIIGLTYRVGVVNYQIDPRSVTIGLTIFAILNALSRPFFGWIIDKKSIFFAGSISLIFIAISGIIAFINRGEVEFVFHLTYGFFWFGLGNWVAIAPLAIKKLFGTHNYGKWFGVLFTAYGIAAIIGTLFGGFILDTYNGTYPIYVLIVGLNVVNLFLLMNLKKRYHASLVG